MRLFSGEGALDQLGSVVEELGGKVVLLVTDPGISRAGHVERALASLREAGRRVAVFDGVEENPTTQHVERGVALARQEGVDFLVGLGGGSALDCTKGINFLYTNGGSMEDYWGFNRAREPMLPSVGIPCTGGTGSEAQSYALISRVDDHQKMACGDEKARFHTVLLDPRLVRTAPPQVAAIAGFDALSHAVESYVATRRSPLSQMFALEAFKLLEKNYESVLGGTADTGTWGEMLLGAHLAGTSVELSMLGAAHACANPLSARFDITHGVAVGLMLPHVVRFNAAEVGELYASLASHGGRKATRAEGLVERLLELRSQARLPERLADLGVREEDLSDLAQEAARQWTALFNPRQVTETDLVELYRAAF